MKSDDRFLVRKISFYVYLRLGLGLGIFCYSEITKKCVYADCNDLSCNTINLYLSF